MDVGSFIAGLIDGLIAFFFGTGLDSLEQVIERVAASPWPDLKAEPFQGFYRVNFGFAALVATVSFTLSILSAGIKQDAAIAMNGIADFIKLFFIGYFLVPVLYLLSYFSNQIAQAITRIPDFFSPNGWSEPLTNALNQASPAMNGVVKIVGDISTSLLGFQADTVSGLLYPLSALLVVSYAAYRYSVVNLIYRISIAGTVTALSFQPLALLVLSIGAVALSLTGLSGGASLGILIVTLAGASILPIILFFSVSARIQKVQIEGPVFTNHDRSAGLLAPASNYTFGSAEARPYQGYVPSPGERMDKIGNSADWVANKAAVAAAALAATSNPFGAAAGATLGATAKAAKVTSVASRYASRHQQERARKRGRY